MSTITLYGPDFSYFLRVIRLLCQFKGVMHETTLSPFGENVTPFGEEHGKLHPFRKIPVLMEGDFILPETPAIAHYLESKPGPSFFPEDIKLRSQVLATAEMFSLYVHQAIMANLVLEFAFPKGPDKTIRFDEINKRLPVAHEVMRWLSSLIYNEHFVADGRFSYCDAVLIPMLDYLEQLPAPYNIITHYDNLMVYTLFHRQQYYAKGVLGEPNIG